MNDRVVLPVLVVGWVYVCIYRTYQNLTIPNIRALYFSGDHLGWHIFSELTLRNNPRFERSPPRVERKRTWFWQSKTGPTPIPTPKTPCHETYIVWLQLRDKYCIALEVVSRGSFARKLIQCGRIAFTLEIIFTKLYSNSIKSGPLIQ